jgi:hypothetical protein
MHIHICLVSAQLLANYIPIRMDKPDQVHLVSSAAMQRNGMTARFQRMLQAQQIETIIHHDMPDSFIAAIHEYALELQETIKATATDAQITLNITGGNKLMMLGMLEIFRPDVQRIIYTDTANNVIECLHDNTNEPLEAVLAIPEYLLAYGATYRKAASDDQAWQIRIGQRKPSTKYLALHAQELAGLIGTLNFLANNALSDNGEVLVTPQQQLNDHPGGQWREALRKLAETQVFAWDGSKTITFGDAESARYVGGIWLEEYVYHIARDAQPDDVRTSVEITWDNSKNTRNELDVLITHNNRMLVIECKTLRLGRDFQKDSDILYKIDSLGADLKGLFGQTWLISAREPTSDMLDRASDRSIRILSPSQIKGLRQEILRWMIPA